MGRNHKGEKGVMLQVFFMSLKIDVTFKITIEFVINLILNFDTIVILKVTPI
jgi:hypothetical protein